MKTAITKAFLIANIGKDMRRKGDRTVRTYLTPRKIMIVDLDSKDPTPQDCWIGNTHVLLRWGMYYKVTGDSLFGPYNTAEEAARYTPPKKRGVK